MTEINGGLAKVQYASLDDLFAVNTDERVRGDITVQTIDGKYLKLPMKSVDAEVEQKFVKHLQQKSLKRKVCRH